ncbi:hypothetical protein ACEQPO_16505 [Bacillus sp. SL00103]
MHNFLKELDKEEESMSDYVEMLAYFGVSSAHPGGIELTKTMLEQIKLTPEHVYWMRDAELVKRRHI